MPFDPLYTFAEAYTELKFRLGNRSDLGDGTADRINIFLKSAQTRVAGCVIECPDLTITGFQMTTVQGQSEYGLLEILPPATNIVGLKNVRNNTTQVKMRRFSWNEYRSLSQQAPGPPMRWARWGYTLAFDPQPDSEYTVIFDYRRLPVDGTTEIPNQFQEDWLHLAEFFGWQALMKPDRAKAAFGQISVDTQLMLNQNLDQQQWESMWDTDQTIAPYGFDYPYSIG